MKIKQTYLYPETSAETYFLSRLQGKDNDDDGLVESLKYVIDNGNYEDLIDLKHFQRVLNLIDSILEKYISKGSNSLTLPDSEVNLEQPAPEVPAAHSNDSVLSTRIELIQLVLKLLSSLLKNSFNKEVFNSMEHIFVLLRAYDNVVAKLAVEVLSSLALPPNYHKCMETSRHTTLLHKNTKSTWCLFEIIEAIQCSYPAESLVAFDFKRSGDQRSVKLDVNRTKSTLISLPWIEEVSFTVNDVDPTMIKSQMVVDDIDLEQRPLQTIIASLPTSTRNQMKFYLMWEIRSKQWLATTEGRMTLLTIYYQLVLTLLCCQADANLLASFFQNKSNILKDFMFLLKTGPFASTPIPQPSDKPSEASPHNSMSPVIPMKLRILGVQCLSAVVGSRDTSSSSILEVLGRFSWLQQDLGINRLQYMGLLPCLIRVALAKLCNLPSIEPMDVDSTSNLLTEEYQYDEQLDWIEAILCLVMSLINMTSSALPTLTETGFMPSMLNVLRSSPNRLDSKMRIYMNSLILQLIDAAIGNNAQTLASFREAKGVEVLINRLLMELQLVLKFNAYPSEYIQPESVASSGNGSEILIRLAMEPPKVISYCNQIVILQLLTVMSSFFHDERAENGGTDPRQTQIVKCSSLTTSIDIVLSYPSQCQAAILSSAINLLTDLVNGDSAPPTVLNHFMAIGLIEKVMSVLKSSSRDVFSSSSNFSTAQMDTEIISAIEIILDSSLLQSVTNMLSAVALTKDGLNLICAMNPFPYIFQYFHQEKYYKSPNNLFKNDLSAMIGGSLEELLRHYPQLQTMCITSLTQEIQDILVRSERFLNHTTSPATNTLKSYETEQEMHEIKQSTTIQISPSVFDLITAGKRDCQDSVLNFIPYLQYAATALVCLETLLLRKQSAVEFLNNDGITILFRLHRLALGPSRYLLSSLQCSINLSNFTIGHQQVISLVLRCVNHLWTAEPSDLLASLFQQADASRLELYHSLKRYYVFHSKRDKYGSTEIFDLTDQSDRVFREMLTNFLETISSAPLYDCYDSSGWNLQPDTELFAAVLRSLAKVDIVVEMIGTAMKSTTSSSAMSNTGPVKAVFALLKKSENQHLIKVLLSDLYVGTQIEMSRAKGVTINKSSEIIKDQPLYRLLVTGRDNIIVRDSPEDSGKRVCRYEKGSVVLAYERVLSSNNMVKYRTEDGWVSYLKSITSADIQIEVVDVFKKSPEMIKAENETFDRESQTWPILKRFNYYKLVSISGSRSGLMSFFHFHSSIRLFLSGLIRNFYYADHSTIGRPANTIGDHAPTYISLLLNKLHLLTPEESQLPKLIDKEESELLSTPSVEIASEETVRTLEEGQSKILTSSSAMVETDTLKFHDASHKPLSGSSMWVRLGIHNKSDNATNCTTTKSTMKLPKVADKIFRRIFGTNIASIQHREAESFEFHAASIPNMSKFGCQNAYLIGNLVETSFSILFDEKGRGRFEANHIMIINAFYTDRILERILYGTRLIFLSSLQRKEFLSEEKIANPKTLIEELDSEFISKFDDEEDISRYYEDLVMKGMPNSMKKAFRTVRERKALSLSSLESVIDLWKQLVAFCHSSTSSPFERQLQGMATPSRDYDPYVCKRSILILMVRYLLPAWTHKLVYSLPSTTLKCLLELIQQFTKAVQDVKAFPIQSSYYKTDANGSRIKSSSIATSTVRDRSLSDVLESSGISGSVTVGRRGRDFRLSQASIDTLIGMGFTRNNVVSAIASLQTNNVSILTDVLLTNQYAILPDAMINQMIASIDNLEDSAQSSTSLSAAGATFAQPFPTGFLSSSIESNAGSAQSGPTPLTSESEIDFLAAVDSAPINESRFILSSNQPFVHVVQDITETLEDTAIAAPSDGTLSTEVIDQASIHSVLPLIPKMTVDDIKTDRSTMPYIFLLVYSSLKTVSLNVIENYRNGPGVIWDPVSAILNHGVNREGVTFLVLNLLWKGLEKQQWPENSLKIIILSWLYRRANDILENRKELTPNNAYRLYGLLLSIILLLNEKITTSTSRQQPAFNEVLFLIFTRDERYNTLYQKLIDAIQDALRDKTELWELVNIVKSEHHHGEVNATFPENVCINAELQWIVPAMLLLDMISQPILFDPVHIDSNIKSLKYVCGEEQFISELGYAKLFSEICTPQLLKSVKELFAGSTHPSAIKKTSSKYLEELKTVINTNEDVGKKFRTICNSKEMTPEEKQAALHTLFQNQSSSIDELSTQLNSESRKRKYVDYGKGPVSIATIAEHYASVSAVNRPHHSESVSDLDPVHLSPLNDQGLDPNAKKLCVEISVEILQMIIKLKQCSDELLKLKASAGSLSFNENQNTRVTCLNMFRSSLAQASLQLLVHLTRDADLRVVFQKLSGNQKLLLMEQMFESMPSLIFTLMQYQLEEPLFLQSSMETAIKLCWSRLSSQPQKKNQPVKFKTLIEVLAPLVYRNQAIFMKAIRACCEFKTFDLESEVLLKEIVTLNPLSSVSTKIKPLETCNDDETESSKRLCLEMQGHETESDSRLFATPMHSQDVTAGNTPNRPQTTIICVSAVATGALTRTPITLSTTTQKSIRKVTTPTVLYGSLSSVDKLLSALIIKWAQVHLKEFSTGFADIPALPISELLITVADLVTSIPTLGSLVHRFNISKCYYLTQSQISTIRSSMNHVITDSAIWPCSFVTFMVHFLILTPIGKYNVDTPIDLIAPASEEKKMLISQERLLLGNDPINSAIYLFAALVSRAGEGRRRVLTELRNIFDPVENAASVSTDTIERKLRQKSLKTDKQLYAMTKASDVILCLLNPPTTWSARDTFIIPTKDIVSVLLSLKYNVSLGDAICALDMEHPDGMRALIHLATPLELLMRKDLSNPTEGLHASMNSDYEEWLDYMESYKCKYTPASEQLAGMNNLQKSEVVVAANELVLADSLESRITTTIATEQIIDAPSVPCSSQAIVCSSNSIRDRARTMTSAQSEEATLHDTSKGLENEHRHLISSADSMMDTEGSEDGNSSADDEHVVEDDDEDEDINDDDIDDDDEDEDLGLDDNDDDDDDDDEDDDENEGNHHSHTAAVQRYADDDLMDDDDEGDDDDIVVDDHANNNSVADVQVIEAEIEIEDPDDADNAEENNGEFEDIGDDFDDDMEDDLNDLDHDIYEGQDDDGDQEEPDEQDGDIFDDDGLGEIDVDDEFEAGGIVEDAPDEEEDVWQSSYSSLLNDSSAPFHNGSHNNRTSRVPHHQVLGLSMEMNSRGQIMSVRAEGGPPGSRNIPHDTLLRHITDAANAGNMRLQLDDDTSRHMMEFLGSLADAAPMAGDFETPFGPGGPLRMRRTSTNPSHMQGGGDRSSYSLLPDPSPAIMNPTRRPNSGLEFYNSSGRHSSAQPSSAFSDFSRHPASHPLLSIPGRSSPRLNVPPTRGGVEASLVGLVPFNSVSGLGQPQFNEHRQSFTFRASSKRRVFGPIVSDRKWGTDVGEVEPVGSRIDILCERVKVALRGSQEKNEASQTVANQILESGVTASSESSSVSSNLLAKLNKESTKEDLTADLIKMRLLYDASRNSAHFTFDEWLHLNRFAGITPESSAFIASPPTLDDPKVREQLDGDSHGDTVGVHGDSDDDEGLDLDNDSEEDENYDDDNDAADDDEREDQNDGDDGPDNTDLVVMDVADVPVEVSGGSDYAAFEPIDSTALLSCEEGSLGGAVPFTSPGSETISVPTEPSALEQTLIAATSPSLNGASISRDISASMCPPDTSEEVWCSLPFHVQMEVLMSMGLHTQAAQLLDAEIQSCGMDRGVILSLPPDMRAEVLGEESIERKRRASVDLGQTSLSTTSTSEHSDLIPANSTEMVSSVSNGSSTEMIVDPNSDNPNAEPSTDGAEILSSTSSSSSSSSNFLARSTANQLNALFTTSDSAANIISLDSAHTPAAAPSLSENAMFVEMLPPDIRREALISADAEFLSSLPIAVQEEAQALRRQHARGLGIAIPRPTNHNEFDRMQEEANEFATINRRHEVELQTSDVSDDPDEMEATELIDVHATESLHQSSQSHYDEYLAGVNRPTATREHFRANGAGAFSPFTAPGTNATADGGRKPRSAVIPNDIDCTTLFLPYDKRLIARLCVCLVDSSRIKVPRPVLRLLSTCCRYKSGRKFILDIIMVLLRDRSESKLIAVLESFLEFKANPLHTSQSEAMIQTDMKLIIELSTQSLFKPDRTIITRRLSSVLFYLVRKSHLVWADVLEENIPHALPAPQDFMPVSEEMDPVRSFPAPSPVEKSPQKRQFIETVDEKNNSLSAFSESTSATTESIFTQLFSLIEPHSQSNGNLLESVIITTETICLPLSDLSIEQADELVANQKKCSLKVEVAHEDATNTQMVVAEENVSETADDAPKAKRARVSFDDNITMRDAMPSSDIADKSTLSALPSASNFDTSSPRVDTLLDAHPVIQADQPDDSCADFCKKIEDDLKLLFVRGAFDSAREYQLHLDYLLTRARTDKAKRMITFPTVTTNLGTILASAIGSRYCIGSMKKRMMKVIQTLSLSSDNWIVLLECLTKVGCSVEFNVFTDVEELHGLIKRTYETNPNLNASSILSLPQLSSPCDLPEVHLLQIVRTMMTLRPKESPNFLTILANFFFRLQNDSLWDLLSECLDLVRDLEGLVDHTALEEDEIAGDATPNPKSPRHQRRNQQLTATMKEPKALSILTTRFMPLIECFMTVSSATVLRHPLGNKFTSGTPSRICAHCGAVANKLCSGCRKASYCCKEHQKLDWKKHRSICAAARINDSDASITSMSDEDVASLLIENSTSSSSSMIASANRKHSLLVGLKFRKNISYWSMQMGLSKDSSSNRLLQFIRKNHLLLNIILRNNISLLEGSFSPLITVPKLRHYLHFDIKRAFFRLKLKQMRHNTARTSGGSLRISIRRQNIFEDSFNQLRHKTADEMRKRLAVSFQGEDGMDAGGLTREWFSVLAREIFNANYALFKATIDNVTFQPNAQSYINNEHLQYFKFVGRVIGKAICDGHLMDAHFTRSFYKHILGLPVTYQDLELIEPEYYNSMKQILDFPLEVLGLDLTFSAETHDFGQINIVDLIENGRNIAVTEENKAEYVQLMAHHRMVAAIIRQIEHFLTGLHELVPAELISIFDSQELELLISGLPNVDVDDLRANTEYHGYKPTDPQIEYFWSILQGFSTEEKALFLQFVTGTSKVPLEGFQSLQGADGVKKFNIHKAYGTHLLPTAHTCFNQLDLPEYASEETMKEKLLVAIREGSEGFGFA